MRLRTSIWRAVAVLLGAFFAASSGDAAQTLTFNSQATRQQNVEFDVFLPLRNADQLDQLISSQHTQGSASYHQWLTPTQFRSRFGPRRQDVARTTARLRASGLTVTGTHSHGVHVTGKVDNVQSAFGVVLWNATTRRGRATLAATRPLSLPREFIDAGAQVLAFSPAVHMHSHVSHVQAIPANRYGAAGPYWFSDLKQAYDFPSVQALDGAGTTIGVVIPSDVLDSDIAGYFAHEKLTPPKVIHRPVYGGTPFDPNDGNSLEAALDVEQSGGMAPGATIVVYSLPDFNDTTVLAGYLTLVEENQVDIVNSSFGGAEGLYARAYNGGADFSYIARITEEVFKQGNAQGITFVASSGDSGALGLPPVAYVTTPPQDPPAVVGSFLPGIEFPASSPSVTAVGGTNLVTTSNPPSLESTYVSENAFGDPEVPIDPYGIGNLISDGYWGSGGGQSVLFAKPAYQKLVETHAATRAIPDVSLQMGGCPTVAVTPCGPDRSSVVVAWNGALYPVVGTSVSSPEFAGLLALEAQNLGGRLGNVNYLIYAQAAAQLSSGYMQFFRQGIPGYNGYYSTTSSGYNMVLGNGTVHARNFILAPFAPRAGDPQTPSNP
jgi:subtilase family serine protease